MKRAALLGLVLALMASTATIAAPPEDAIGTSFPADFDVPNDSELHIPLAGFGSSRGPVSRTPVIFLHGNNDTAFPTDCNGAYGKVQAFAQYFLDAGYRPKELWAMSYQGDQCDLVTDQRRRASGHHTTVANVPDLRAFVRAVLDYTGASQVDLVGHSLGATLSREWMRQDNAYGLVRKLVSVDGPHHGIINCSPGPMNYYQSIGFVPDSPVCREYGSADSEFLTRLNRGDETPGPTRYLALRNADTSFVYMDRQDGVLPPVPPEDSKGRPHDFSRSAALDGARNVDLTGQGAYDQALLAAHTGIVNSPDAWALAFEFLVTP